MPIRCCYKPGHRVPAEPPGVIGGGDAQISSRDSGGRRGDAATGVTRRRWRGQSAGPLYQGADKPVPEFISHNDQICGGGGAACRRGGAATCWNGCSGPPAAAGTGGTAREPGQAVPSLSHHPPPLSCPCAPAAPFSIPVIPGWHRGRAGTPGMSRPEQQQPR